MTQIDYTTITTALLGGCHTILDLARHFGVPDNHPDLRTKVTNMVHSGFLTAGSGDRPGAAKPLHVTDTNPYHGAAVLTATPATRPLIDPAQLPQIADTTPTPAVPTGAGDAAPMPTHRRTTPTPTPAEAEAVAGDAITRLAELARVANNSADQLADPDGFYDAEDLLNQIITLIRKSADAAGIGPVEDTDHTTYDPALHCHLGDVAPTPGSPVAVDGDPGQMWTHGTHRTVIQRAYVVPVDDLHGPHIVYNVEHLSDEDDNYRVWLDDTSPTLPDVYHGPGYYSAAFTNCSGADYSHQGAHTARPIDDNDCKGGVLWYGNSRHGVHYAPTDQVIISADLNAADHDDEDEDGEPDVTGGAAYFHGGDGYLDWSCNNAGTGRYVELGFYGSEALVFDLTHEQLDAFATALHNVLTYTDQPTGSVQTGDGTITLGRTDEGWIEIRFTGTGETAGQTVRVAAPDSHARALRNQLAADLDVLL